MTHVKHRPHIKDISQAQERCSNRPKAIVGEEGVSYRTHKTASVALATLVLLLCDSIKQYLHLTEQVDNPDHSLFRPPWNATKQSYAKQRGKWTMRAQSNAANSEPDTVVPFAPAFENAAADSTDQLDRAGQTILNCCRMRRTWPKPTASMRSTWRRGFRISSAQPKQELRSWRPRGSRTRTGPNARNNGCTESTAKSRIDF